MKKKYVVYCATNTINGKIYIGKTYNFEKRKREHLLAIDDGLPFHRALKKYGVGNFTWEIIDTAKTDKDINEKEVYWIKTLNSCIHSPSSNGYNVTIGGEGGVSWNSRPVIQFSKSGDYISEFLSCAHADIECGLYRGAVQKGATEKTLRGGYQWRHKDEWDGKSIGGYKRNSNSRRRRIVQISLSGDVIKTFNSVSEASDNTGISRANISAALTGKSHTSGGCQWIYANQYVPNNDYEYKGIVKNGVIVKINSVGAIVGRYNNCSEAARRGGMKETAYKVIYKALGSKTHNAYGYRWLKYEDYLNTVGST